LAKAVQPKRREDGSHPDRCEGGPLDLTSQLRRARRLCKRTHPWPKPTSDEAHTRREPADERRAAQESPAVLPVGLPVSTSPSQRSPACVKFVTSATPAAQAYREPVRDNIRASARIHQSNWHR